MTDAIAVQIRRGTRLENNQFTGLQGEMTAVIDGNNTTCRIHDGLTLGGFEFALTTMSNVDFDKADVARKSLSNVALETFGEKGLLYRDLTNITRNIADITAAGLADIHLSNINEVDGDSLTRNNIARADLSNVEDADRERTVYSPDGTRIIQHGLAFRDMSNVDYQETRIMKIDASNITPEGVTYLSNQLMTAEGGFLKTNLSNIQDLSLVQNSCRNKIPNNQGLVNPQGALSYISTTATDTGPAVPVMPGSETFKYWYILNGTDAQKAATEISYLNGALKGEIALRGGFYIHIPDLLGQLSGEEWYLSVDNLFALDADDTKHPITADNNGLLFALAFVDNSGNITKLFTPWTKLSAPDSSAKLQNWALMWDYTEEDETQLPSENLKTLNDWNQNEVSGAIEEIENSRVPVANPYADAYLCIRTDGITTDTFNMFVFDGIQLEPGRQTIIENMPTFTQTPDMNMRCGTF